MDADVQGTIGFREVAQIVTKQELFRLPKSCVAVSEHNPEVRYDFPRHARVHNLTNVYYADHA